MISISLENFADLLSKAVAEYDLTGYENDNIRSIFYDHGRSNTYSFEADNLIFIVKIRYINISKKDYDCIINAFIKYDKTTIFQCDMMRTNRESVKELFDTMLKRYE